MNLVSIPISRTFEAVDGWMPHFLTFARRRNAQHIWQRIHDGEIQIHLVMKDGASVAAIGTHTYDHEKGRIADLVWCGGENIPAILDILPTLEHRLGEQGCSRIILTGREGWLRLLRPRGYRKAQITLEKALV
jgi:hypothetical protein